MRKVLQYKFSKSVTKKKIENSYETAPLLSLSPTHNSTQQKRFSWLHFIGYNFIFLFSNYIIKPVTSTTHIKRLSSRSETHASRKKLSCVRLSLALIFLSFLRECVLHFTLENREFNIKLLIVHVYALPASRNQIQRKEIIIAGGEVSLEIASAVEHRK